MTRYFIGIGSNENARENCLKMIQAIEAQFAHVKVSRIVQTKAWGQEAPDYLNAVVCMEANLDIGQLDQWCKAQELKLGRDRTNNRCAADLDILYIVDMDKGEKVSLEKSKAPYFQPLLAELL